MTNSDPKSIANSDPDAEVPRLRALIEANRYAEAMKGLRPLLATEPGHRDLSYLLAVALRMQRQIPQALELLAEIEAWHPEYSRLFQERGNCYIGLRDAPNAIAAFEHAVNLNPALPASWSSLQALYRMTGRQEDTERAAQHVAKLGALPAEIVTARSMLADGDLREAEDVIRPYLERNRGDIEAMRLLANIAAKNDFPLDAEVLLRAVLEHAPDYHAARYDYVLALVDLHKHTQARTEVEQVIAAQPANPAGRITLASILLGLGELDEAIARYLALIEELPSDAELVQSLGHAFKTKGQPDEAVSAYQKAVEVRPGFGEPFWSLANLKTYRFKDIELDAMRAQEATPSLSPVDRYHICFALGKALEDRGEFAESFIYYERGNAFKKRESRYRSTPYERSARRQRELCDDEFFAARQGWGSDSVAPIFILGLPRAGSTLLEQILASHSQVEGTMELANIPRLVSSLAGKTANPAAYPDLLTDLTKKECRRFAHEYLNETLDYRSGMPHFIDKMPNNFRNIGLIQLMFPHAKIIDARRAAMDCCFSNFKQLYANGHHFSYSLEDIGDYYRIYVDTMEHWDRVLPGRVLRVQYEDVIDDLESAVQRILDYCGLAFERACVEFYKTKRTVHTASAEQVRRPINREGIGQWRPYSEWLTPLSEVLGSLD